MMDCRSDFNSSATLGMKRPCSRRALISSASASRARNVPRPQSTLPISDSGFAVIVAVALVNVVAMTVDDVIDVVVVLHRAMTAARTVGVLRIVTFTDMLTGGGAHI